MAVVEEDHRVEGHHRIAAQLKLDMEEAFHRMLLEQTIAETIIADPPKVAPLPDELDPRVLAGVKFLDETTPGWADKIDLDRFSLSNGTQCVIGQVHGNYGENVEEVLGEDWNGRQMRLGFNLPGTARGHEWDLLEEDWRIAIATRQTRHG